MRRRSCASPPACSSPSSVQSANLFKSICVDASKRACRRRTPRTRVDLRVLKDARPFQCYPLTRSSPRRSPSACADNLLKIDPMQSAPARSSPSSAPSANPYTSTYVDVRCLKACGRRTPTVWAEIARLARGLPSGALGSAVALRRSPGAYSVKKKMSALGSISRPASISGACRTCVPDQILKKKVVPPYRGRCG